MKVELNFAELLELAQALRDTIERSNKAYENFVNTCPNDTLGHMYFKKNMDVANKLRYNTISTLTAAQAAILKG